MDTVFIEDLASSKPTPGGGGASAYVGALASALASMVGSLTVGKKRYAEVEGDVYVVLEKLALLRERLLELVDEDARAFAPLAAAYAMPAHTDEQREAKRAAVQEALPFACDVPLEIMESVWQVAGLAEYLANNGNRLALSDAGVAAAFVRAASDGASLNIYINAAAMEDEEQAERYRRSASSLAERTRIKCDEIFDFVREAVS